MKILSILFLSLILGKGGCESQNDLSSAEVVYSAYSRGFYREITITDKRVSIVSERNSTKAPQIATISEADWDELVKAFGNLKLEQIPTLKAPTEKRFYDGAAIAKIKINFNDKTYESTEFDHGFPPKELENFINKINALAAVK